MSTDTAATEHAAEAHTDHGAAGGHAEHHKPDSYYIKVALILAGLTAAETSTYWMNFNWLVLTALMLMMFFKFVMVVLLFMHLKDDHKMFSWLFYAGLGLAIGVYVAALATFRYFG